jgi:phosphoribosylamine--glycine ligase
MASGGYPGEYETGHRITGLGKIKDRKQTIVFHAGTALRGGELVTNGGRVLGVTAKSTTSLQKAAERAYNNVKHIKFENAHYRTDIGNKK